MDIGGIGRKLTMAINLSFLKGEMPFSIGPYMPISMLILKYSYGNFKKYILLNIISDGLFAFLFIDIKEVSNYFKRLKSYSIFCLFALQSLLNVQSTL